MAKRILVPLAQQERTEAVLLPEADAFDADLIAMTAAKPRLLRSTFAGGVSGRVRRKAKAPVILLSARKRR
jgi:nucleotide-binding universal stress UspA family protein